QNLSPPRVSIFPRRFCPVVRSNSLRTSGRLLISSTVSAIIIGIEAGAETGRSRRGVVVVKATKSIRRNESEVCYQTRTLRSCLLSRRNARQKFFLAHFAAPRVARFSGRRNCAIWSSTIGH